MPIFLKYILAWFPMLVLAIMNGALRDLVYGKYLGEPAAHQASTFLLLIILGLYIRYIIFRIPPKSGAHAWGAGLLWLVLTLAFEFGFGMFRGLPLHRMLEDYDVMKGHFWILVPVWMAVAPYLFFRILR